MADSLLAEEVAGRVPENASRRNEGVRRVAGGFHSFLKLFVSGRENT